MNAGNLIMCRSSRTGLTLIELLVATLLSALLMALIGGVLRSIDRQRRWSAREARRAPATSILQQQLERDLANARRIETGRDAMRLTGWLAEDPRTRLPLLRRAEIRYTVEQVGGRACLVRTLRQGVAGTPRRRRDILWCGVGKLEVIRFDVASIVPDGAGESQKKKRDADRMPSRVEVVIRDTAGEVLCRTDVVH